jgi:hypothetical protein
MFGSREMLLSSQEPVVRQFLNARRQGPIGMAEEKDAAELEAEKDEDEGPPLPPIPPQMLPSSGVKRPTQPEPGAWLRANNVTPPRGSFMGDDDYGDPDAPDPKQERDRVVVGPTSTATADEPAAAEKAPEPPKARSATAAKTVVIEVPRKSAVKKAAAKPASKAAAKADSKPASKSSAKTAVKKAAAGKQASAKQGSSDAKPRSRRSS